MKKKVLIVEDEFIVANNLRQVVQGTGYEVTGIASSASEAEEMLQKNKPDIVLLDIRLQGPLSGIDIARKLKEQHIAFIYLSANSSQKVLEEAKTTEPYGFLVKPFRKRDLLVMLDIAWYRHQHSVEAKQQQLRLLGKQVLAAVGGGMKLQEKLVCLAKTIQSYLPFELMSLGIRPLDEHPFNDLACLRIGFDEYQFIGEKELLTIANIKKTALPVILANSDTVRGPAICSDTREDQKPPIPSLQHTLFETFHLRSLLAFPVMLPNGTSVHYFFYSRQPDIYSIDHLTFLHQLKTDLSQAAEKILLPAKVSGTNSALIHGEHETGRATSTYTAFNEIIGNNHLLLAALDLTAQVAPYNTSVLILGESGTGKEKIAQAIHLLSPRSGGPFVKVNCAAIPSTLIESELFGHEKGAFTGAIDKRKGRFEQADKGTIFLDEIGELTPEMQVKILRVLQEKEIEYVGGAGPVKVNVRVIAATNRNLEKEMAEKKFRLDLYYRLNVFPITLPPLRDRSSDIETLARYFGERFCREFNKPFHGLSPSMTQQMLSYHWPGNIRELENVMEQSAILNDGNTMLELKRPLISSPGENLKKPDIKTLDDIKKIQRETEKAYIVSVLKKTQGRIRGANGAAEILNIKPTTLESRIEKLDIRKEDFAS